MPARHRHTSFFPSPEHGKKRRACPLPEGPEGEGFRRQFIYSFIAPSRQNFVK
jgi:hypothetical protein